MDEELIYYLNNIIKYCDDKLKVNPNTHYVISITVLQSLVYCLEQNEIDKFNTILKFISTQKSNYINSISIMENN